MTPRRRPIARRGARARRFAAARAAPGTTARIGGALAALLLATGAAHGETVRLAQQGTEHGGHAAEGGEHAGRAMGRSMERQRYVMRNAIPAAYRSRQNPLEPTAERLERGRRAYAANCASCHGESGRGNGPAAAALDPRPADLARTVRMPVASDAYLYWTIAEGGAPVGSPMPAYKQVFDERTAWALILYLRRL